MLQAFDGRLEIPKLDTRACTQQARFEIGAVEIAETDPYFRNAFRIPANAPPLGERQKVRARVDEQALARGDIGEMPHRPLFVGLDFQDLLVEGDRLRKKTIVGEVGGDVVVLRDGPVNLPGPIIGATFRF